MSRFGAKLRCLRKVRGWTQHELAQRLGYSSHTYLSEVERGRKEPSLDLVISVADLFAVTTDQLLRDHLKLDAEEEDDAVR